MRFCQFYTMSTGYDIKTNTFRDELKAPMQALGDRSVIILDARERLESSASVCRIECVKRGYLGFEIYEAPRFSSSSDKDGLVRKYETINF